MRTRCKSICTVGPMVPIALVWISKSELIKLLDFGPIWIVLRLACSGRGFCKSPFAKGGLRGIYLAARGKISPSPSLSKRGKPLLEDGGNSHAAKTCADSNDANSKSRFSRLRPRCEFAVAQRDLPFPREINRLAENARRLLWRMPAFLYGR